jgi:hypothetical protein
MGRFRATVLQSKFKLTAAHAQQLADFYNYKAATTASAWGETVFNARSALWQSYANLLGR